MTSKLRVLDVLAKGPADRATLERAVGTRSAANVISQLIRLGAVRKLYVITPKGGALLQDLRHPSRTLTAAQKLEIAQEALNARVQDLTRAEVERLRHKVQMELSALRVQRARELPGTAGLTKS